MERVSIPRIPVRHGEIDGDGKFNFAATKHILKERVLSLNSQLFQGEGQPTFVQLELGLVFAQLTESHILYSTKEFVLARSV